jgi:hypothetical protein
MNGAGYSNYKNTTHALYAYWEVERSWRNAAKQIT